MYEIAFQQKHTLCPGIEKITPKLITILAIEGVGKLAIRRFPKLKLRVTFRDSTTEQNAQKKAVPQKVEQPVMNFQGNLG
jgi:hypothetical protein